MTLGTKPLGHIELLHSNAVLFVQATEAAALNQYYTPESLSLTFVLSHLQYAYRELARYYGQRYLRVLRYRYLLRLKTKSIRLLENRSPPRASKQTRVIGCILKFVSRRSTWH
jgi:hypothetical protein